MQADELYHHLEGENEREDGIRIAQHLLKVFLHRPMLEPHEDRVGDDAERDEQVQKGILADDVAQFLEAVPGRTAIPDQQPIRPHVESGRTSLVAEVLVLRQNGMLGQCALLDDL